MQADITDIMLRGKLQQGKDVFLVVVHAAGRQQPHDMDRTASPRRSFQGVLQHPVFEERPVLYRLGDAGELLVNDASRSDIHMACFRVAHLSGGQSHVHAGRIQQGAGTVVPQVVPHRLPGAVDRVIGGSFRIAPAIQDDQNHWTVLQLHGGLRNGIG